MGKSKNEVKTKIKVNKDINKIGFWKVTDKYGEFSNWHLCEFTYNGINFTSSEQALMYMKAITFHDNYVATKILATNSQSSIKSLGRTVQNYDDKVWAKERYGIMVDILKAKFNQNENLKDKLINTNDSMLYEASPYDRVWGIGSTDVNYVNGQNLLGKALMEVREFIKNSNKEGENNND